MFTNVDLKMATATSNRFTEFRSLAAANRQNLFGLGCNSLGVRARLVHFSSSGRPSHQHENWRAPCSLPCLTTPQMVFGKPLWPSRFITTLAMASISAKSLRPVPRDSGRLSQRGAYPRPPGAPMKLRLKVMFPQSPLFDRVFTIVYNAPQVKRQVSPLRRA